MYPNVPPTITTPDRIGAWWYRLKQAQHSPVSQSYYLVECTPATPFDSRHHCPICLGLLHNPVETPCGHVFCGHCIVSALKSSPTCPLDRNPIPQPPGLPIAVSFPLNYPNDCPSTRLYREIKAFRDCGAFLDPSGPVKQALAEMRIQCPFRKSEGCMAELPWCSWDLHTHITEMRHGEGPSSDGDVTKTYAQPLHQPADLPDPSPPPPVHHQKPSPQGGDPEPPNTASRNDLKSKPPHWLKRRVHDLREWSKAARTR